MRCRQPWRGVPEPAVDDDGRLVAQAQALRLLADGPGDPGAPAVDHAPWVGIATLGRTSHRDTQQGGLRTGSSSPPARGEPRPPPGRAPPPPVLAVPREPRARPARSPRRRSRDRGPSRARPPRGRSRCRRSRRARRCPRRRAFRPAAPRGCRSRRSRVCPRPAGRAGLPRARERAPVDRYRPRRRTGWRSWRPAGDAGPASAEIRSAAASRPWRLGLAPGPSARASRSPSVATAIATVLVAPASTPTRTGDASCVPVQRDHAQIIAEPT